MRPKRIDQVVPSFGRRDAIGEHVLFLRAVLRDIGFESDIWCVGAFEDARSECRLLGELDDQPRPGTWWLYHLSNGSPAAEVMLERSEPVLIDYHNITPGELFEPWVGWAVESAREARRQMAELAKSSMFAFADSAFNEAELRQVGFGKTAVVPPMFDPSVHATTPDPITLEELRENRSTGGVDWLFVGRVAPPKAQHDLIKAFACFRRFYDNQARLHLLGTWMTDEYARALMRFSERLGLRHVVELVGTVEEGVLAAYFRSSDVYVSASDHEGFCIPILEAMHFEVPVVAYGAAAVPETAADAALVLEEKRPMLVAAAVDRVLNDPRLRSGLVAAGRRRADEFTLARSRERWRRAIEEAVTVCDGRGPRA